MDGIPILINEEASVFSIKDLMSGHRKARERTSSAGGRLTSALLRASRHVPSIGKSYGSEEGHAHFAGLLKAIAQRPRVLIVGGSIEGVGIRQILDDPTLELVETDVTFGPRTMLICDAHDLPFSDASFDGVIIQAVLEHVADPQRCVAEIYRVLVESGVVIAETPFMQGVHMGPYDFTRFTHLGHRRLFRRFEEIASAPVAGPGMALAWAYRGFLMSFVKSRAGRAIVRRIAAYSAFWLKYLDPYLIRKPGAYDAAAGFSFLGRKRDGYELSDRDLLKQYRGAQAQSIGHGGD